MFGFDTTDKISWLQVLILSIIPLGQLWARVFNFKGSLDKPWLLFPIFLFPPFSFLPLIMMKFDAISDGKGADPVDKIMILPIIAKFAVPFILPHIIDDEDNESLISYISMFLQFLMIMVAMMTRRYFNCDGFTLNSFGKAGIDSIITNGFANFVPFIVGWIPFIGMFTSVLEMVVGDFLNDILWSIGFIAAYALVNMFNQSDMTEFCNAPFTGYTSDKIAAAGAIGVSIISSIF